MNPNNVDQISSFRGVHLSLDCASSLHYFDSRILLLPSIDVHRRQVELAQMAQDKAEALRKVQQELQHP